MTNRSKPPRLFGRINCEPSASLPDLVNALADAGYVVVRLDGAGVIDAATFLARMQRDIPGPDDEAAGTLDDASDWMSLAFADRSEQRIAVVWTDADQLLRASLVTLFSAVKAFADLAHVSGMFSVPKSIIVCLVGDGEMFAGGDG